MLVVRQGEACRFRHEPSALGTETVCAEWEEGQCSRIACPYRHMDIQVRCTFVLVVLSSVVTERF